MPWQESERRTFVRPPAPAAKTPSSPNTPRPGRLRMLWERFEDFIGWPIDLIFRHFEKRLFELAMTVAMIGEGILLMVSPRSIDASSFHYLTGVVPLWLCITIFMGLGGARIVALVLNGHWMPHGAYVRAVGAVAGAVMWAQMCAALATWNVTYDVPLSPGVPIYSTLALFEIVSMYFALIGAKVYGRHR